MIRNLLHHLLRRSEGSRAARAASLPALATAALAALAVAACGGSTAGSSPTPSASSPAGLRRANVAAGTLVEVGATTLVLSTSNGDVTVSYSGTTPVTVTGTGSYADIQVGSCINATGTKDATGAVTAASVTISSPVNGSCALGSIVGRSPGAFPSGGARTTFRPRVTPPANLASVRGTVAAVNVTQVTVQKADGTSQTITVPTTVKVSTTSTGSGSDLVQGACVAALGPRAASGTVTARSLVIAPAGPSGCFTGGTGGFGGFGGGGPGIFGGGGTATS